MRRKYRELCLMHFNSRTRYLRQRIKFSRNHDLMRTIEIRDQNSYTLISRLFPGDFHDRKKTTQFPRSFWTKLTHFRYFPGGILARRKQMSQRRKHGLLTHGNKTAKRVKIDYAVTVNLFNTIRDIYSCFHLLFQATYFSL